MAYGRALYRDCLGSKNSHVLNFLIHTYVTHTYKDKTRNSLGDVGANVYFLYDDIVHALQNRIDSCINSATGQRGYVLERMCLPNSVK